MLCRNVELGGQVWDGAFFCAAQVYNPHRIMYEHIDPVRSDLSDAPPPHLECSMLKASACTDQPLPERASARYVESPLKVIEPSSPGR